MSARNGATKVKEIPLLSSSCSQSRQTDSSAVTTEVQTQGSQGGDWGSTPTDLRQPLGCCKLILKLLWNVWVQIICPIWTWGSSWALRLLLHRPSNLTSRRRLKSRVAVAVFLPPGAFLWAMFTPLCPKGRYKSCYNSQMFMYSNANTIPQLEILQLFLLRQYVEGNNTVIATASVYWTLPKFQVLGQ